MVVIQMIEEEEVQVEEQEFTHSDAPALSAPVTTPGLAAGLAAHVTTPGLAAGPAAHVTTPRLADNNVLLPRRSRETRHRDRTRPLAPLDEARRILSQVEMQRAAADAANASAHAEMAQSLQGVAYNLGRLADVAERYLEYLINAGSTL